MDTNNLTSNFEDSFQHPFIFCKHNLDISNSDDFAQELSKKLKLNIEIHNSSNQNSYLYTTSTNKHYQLAQLKKRNSLLIPDIKYELTIDDIVFIIFEDFIEINTNLTLDYFHLLQLKKEEKLTEIDIFEAIFNYINALGEKQVIFCIFDELNIHENFHFSWINIQLALKKCNYHFQLKI